MGRRRRHSRGFTLIEVLLAVMVTAVVVTAVLMAYKTSLDNVAYTKRSLSEYGTAKTALERMILDLESVHVMFPPEYKPPDSSLSEPDPYRVSTEEEALGESDFPSLRFASLAHVDLAGTGLTGVSEIRYYVTRAPGDEEGYVLRRRDRLGWDLFPSLESQDPILCDRIKSVKYTFYDEEGEEQDRWNSEDSQYDYATPSAVKITIEMAGGEDRPDASLPFETRVELPVHRGPSDTRR